MASQVNPEMLKVTKIRAIDVHAHYGVFANAASKIWQTCMSGDVETVLRRAEQSHIEILMVSPLKGLMPRGAADPVTANVETFEQLKRDPRLRQWVIVDPRKSDTFNQASEMCLSPQCVGIKIHPEEHVYPIKDYGDHIFSFAAKHHLIVLTHSGEENSLPEDFLPFADGYPEVKLILAHLGCGYDKDPTHQVRAIAACRHGNVFVDTSSACNIQSDLVEWAVREIGADWLLFGTDNPLYFTPMQRARIDFAEISASDKCKILRENAIRLFGKLVTNNLL